MDITDPTCFTIKKRPYCDDFVIVEFTCDSDEEAQKAILDITRSCHEIMRLKQILKELLK